METRFIEATNHGNRGNWGKFMVGRFTPDEWRVRSAVSVHGLIASQGWDAHHVLVLDLATGEGAVFLPGGSARHDLNEKHQIWCCPLFEPFLVWLYQQDLTDLATLPLTVELPDAPVELFGRRRDRGQSVVPVVHTLRRGQVVCGFSRVVPAEWPIGHSWLDVTEVEQITCRTCKRYAEYIRDEKR